MTPTTFDERVSHLDKIIKTERERLEDLHRQVDMQEAVLKAFEASRAVMVANYAETR